MACNARNPFPAQLFNNESHLLDVYGNDVEVDYRGYEVTVANFLQVLTGEPLSEGLRLMSKPLESMRSSTTLVNEKAQPNTNSDYFVMSGRLDKTSCPASPNSLGLLLTSRFTTHCPDNATALPVGSYSLVRFRTVCFLCRFDLSLKLAG